MIRQVIVYTSKLNETVDFYQWLLDLPIARKIERPNGNIVFLGAHETKLELIENATAEPVNSKSITIGFNVDDLDKKLAMLQSKQIAHSDVTASGATMRFVFFTDLNGCTIQLVEDKPQ